MIAPLLCCIALLCARPSASGALQDSDTAFLLSKLRERHSPLSWFAGDWPLGNHFYRPISTLAFEADNAMFGDSPDGYIFTNCLLVAGCILATFWLVSELFASPLLASVAATAFGLWNGPWQPDWLMIRGVAVAVVALGGLARHGVRVDRYGAAICVAWYLGFELSRQPLYSRVAGWIPGRTASVMALFALVALAAYARFERISAARERSDPSPLDPPGRTRGESVVASGRKPGNWLMVSAVAVLLALGSYEQAVMVPALLVAVACALRWQGFRVRWIWLAVPFSALALYLWVRSALLPAGASGYQKQQFRTGPGLWGDLGGYAFPGWNDLNSFWVSVSTGLEMLTVSAPWLALLSFCSNAVSYFNLKRIWIVALAGWGMSLIAYLPMAWLKWFAHYEFFPYAFRAILVAALVQLLGDLIVSAWSRPTLQSPRRLAPAAGSLPRP